MGKTIGKPYVHYIFLWFSYMGEHMIRWKPMVKQFGKHRSTFKKMGQTSNKIRDIRELCKWRFIAGKTIEVNVFFSSMFDYRKIIQFCWWEFIRI
jgi:hypothetical protein